MQPAAGGTILGPSCAERSDGQCQCRYHGLSVTKWLEPALAALTTLIGIALTTAGALIHAGPAVAPGALLILVGGGWLGNALARRT